MRRIRTHRSLALFGLVVVVFAVLAPAVAPDLHDLILAPLWLVPPAISIVVVRRTATRRQDQPLALLSLALFRAPPSALVA